MSFVKRILSLILALVLVIGLLPVTARAGALDNGLVYEVYADHVEITDYTGEATEIVIPAEIEGKPVTSIGERAFYNCRSLTAIDFPDSLISIGEYAFYQCYGLTVIDLPDSITSIAKGAFSSCNNLTGIDLPDSLTFIGEDAFRGCVKLQNFRIPAGMKTIDYSAFSGCTGIAYIVLPETLGEICPGSFDGWTSKQIVYVESYTIPLLWLISEEHFGNATVYWAGEWEYVDGVPTPKVEK